jgi:hypothetical protein
MTVHIGGQLAHLFSYSASHELHDSRQRQTRTFRDGREVAYEAAIYLKERAKSYVVQIRDETTEEVSTILPDARMG